jgi:hypothetical protein
MTMLDDGSEPPTFEVRATMADGVRLVVGPFATAAAASEQARELLGREQTRRVETLRRQGEEVQLIGVIGWPAPAPRRDEDDRLRPRHIDGGIVW